MGEHLYYDTEGNGLLEAKGDTPALSVMHCLGAIDIKSGEEFYYGPAVPLDWDWMGVEVPEQTKLLLANPAGTVAGGVERLGRAERIVAHNGIDYDELAIKKLYPEWHRPAQSWDSLVMAKVVWPIDILAEPDFKRAYAKLMPMNMVKRHSLKAWGYRLGDPKDEYTGDPRIEDPEERYRRRWESWNPWMASYMMQDCRPGVKLWNLILDRIGWNPEVKCSVVWPELAVEVEHEVARIIKRQEMHGVHFNVEKARTLAAKLSNELAAIEAKLVETFGSWWAAGEVVTPKADRKVKLTHLPDVTKPRVGKNGKALAPYVGPPVCEYTTDAPYTPIEWTTFQPSSRDHLGQRLQAVYGWKPKMFGKNGKPTVDEGTLEEIPEAVMPKEIRKLLIDYFIVMKTLGTLAKGTKSWLNLVDDNGFIHGQMDTAGAITGRGTHKNPNLSGVPAVMKVKVVKPDGTKEEVIAYGLEGRYGYECKELFEADPGWEFTDMDASSLELIDLGHYLFPLDGGKFSARVCDPTRDAHQENADIADMTRADAKTAIYLFVYGGGAYKLSLALTVEDTEVLELLGYRGLPMLLSNLVKRFDQNFVDKLDDSQKARIAKARIIILKFEGNIEGLKQLKDDITKVAERGWLKGMDGRRVYVRKAYSALNTLLQSAGAQTCKLWMMLVHRELERRGLVYGKDYKQVLWVHDALSFTHRPGLGPLILEVGLACLKEAGVMLGLRGEYRGAGKTANNWAETH
ncbi:DNA polymerase [Mesorhizobium sp. WSM4982]|uniref:DNA polymerase n=1 Tax=Mesorhizobium sp. WSM4982 TaxID=3038550 RepID=UPI002414F4D6|nr:DNA polymerase [Mesorhizobium sp. WSM4982]MDG4856415.1 DNA polymerase [Mesorhizobium sp. WSM4982]